MNLMIQIETTEARDNTALVGAVSAYVATFAEVGEPRPARRYLRKDRGGEISVALHELSFTVHAESAGADMPKAVGKLIKDVLRRSGQEAVVTILVGAPEGSS